MIYNYFFKEGPFKERRRKTFKWCLFSARGSGPFIYSYSELICWSYGLHPHRIITNKEYSLTLNLYSLDHIFSTFWSAYSNTVHRDKKLHQQNLFHSTMTACIINQKNARTFNRTYTLNKNIYFR